MAPIGVFPSGKLPVDKPLLDPGKLKKDSFNIRGNRLYYPGEGGLVHTFNFDATQLLWSFNHFQKEIPPYSNAILASSNDGYLYCFLEVSER